MVIVAVIVVVVVVVVVVEAPCAIAWHGDLCMTAARVCVKQRAQLVPVQLV